MFWSAPHPRFRIYTRPKSYTGPLLDALLGRLHKGDDVERLEQELSARFNVKHAICMPMARVGIHLAVKSVIRPGQQVVMSPYTIADVVNMVIAAGGRPLFADIERSTCNIDPAEVARLIDRQTGAVLVTHLHGIAARTDEIREICEPYGVPVIEDAAQAFGAVDNGRRLGTIGDAGVYSFGMYKNINSWYGGALVTNRDDIAEQVRSEIAPWPYQATGFLLKRMRKGLLTDVATYPPLFRCFTFWIFRYACLHDVEWINRKVRTELDTNRYDSLPSNYRSRLTPCQARLALCQLEGIDADSSERIARARLYHRELQGIPGILLPPSPHGLRHTYSYFPIQCESRDVAIKHLMRHHCDVAPQHLKNCADLQSFAEFQQNCSAARESARSVVLLPTYPRHPNYCVSQLVATIQLANPSNHTTRSAIVSTT